MNSPQWVALRFNSDSGSNYSMTRLTGDGSSASSARVSNYTYLPVAGGDLTTQTIAQCNVMNYSNSTTYKTVLSRSDNASSVTAAYVSLWRSTAAITTIDVITTTSATFSVGSTFTIYGILAA